MSACARGRYRWSDAILACAIAALCACGAWADVVPTNGMVVTANTTFVLTATNSAGPTSEQVSVTVASAPSLSISPTTRAFVAGNPGGTFDANVQGSSGAIRWSLVGAGSIAPSTGPTVVYTPPLTVAGPGEHRPRYADRGAVVLQA